MLKAALEMGLKYKVTKKYKKQERAKHFNVVQKNTKHLKWL